MFGDFLPPEQVAEGVLIYRQYYVEGGSLFDALVYDGVPQALARLQQSGVQLCLATAKPKVTAQKVLDHFDLAQYFAQVGGTVEEAGILDKTGVIRNNLQHSTFAPEAHLMVGDRRDDLQGAATAGIDALGVLYGYGSREELAAQPHKALCNSPDAVAQFILMQG
ncbi:5'-nucleotidase [bioreactor metagenome]|uniref:5'-nucleotidase n=1 Tax=bioreactor metagenome TaxID=1076179 RepID=A0A645JAP3_9ZZZZ